MDNIFTLKLHYLHNISELCELGKKYDTDKSPLRQNVGGDRYCHAYTLFYHALFKSKKDEPITIAECGILEGASLRMWHDYFSQASIYGFDLDTDLISKFETQFKSERIKLSPLDVQDTQQCRDTFQSLNTSYDIFIDDTTHQLEDQIRIIETVYPYINPGGLIIIEDIFKSKSEREYIDRLQPILSEHFQDFYFAEVDHVHTYSEGWNNDKLLVLVKAGAAPQFQSSVKLTLITPTFRIDNLRRIKESIPFDYVHEWIIVYDGKKIPEIPNWFSEEKKIKQYRYVGEGVFGNGQRNFGLSKISDPSTMLYYLDDDNIFHPSLCRLLNVMDGTQMYSFGQQDHILVGDEIRVGKIDTAMVLIPCLYGLSIPWELYKYEADGMYIEQCYHIRKNHHVFVENPLCYYNYLRRNF